MAHLDKLYQSVVGIAVSVIIHGIEVHGIEVHGIEIHGLMVRNAFRSVKRGSEK